MVEAVFTICAVCVVAATLSKVTERYGKEYSIFIAVALIAIIAAFLFLELSPVTSLITTLFDEAGLSEEYTVILFKALGICYVTQLSCDVCKDNGQNAIATLAELSGKLALLLISVPLFEVLTGIIKQLS